MHFIITGIFDLISLLGFAVAGRISYLSCHPMQWISYPLFADACVPSLLTLTVDSFTWTPIGSRSPPACMTDHLHVPGMARFACCNMQCLPKTFAEVYHWALTSFIAPYYELTSSLAKP